MAIKLGIDPVWFAVMIGMNLQASFLTPPFGFSLFYLRSVAPSQIKTTDIYKGVIPFVGVQFVALLVVVFYPQLVTAFRDAPAAKDTSNIEIHMPAPERSTEKPAAGSATPEDRAAAEIERMLQQNR